MITHGPSYDTFPVFFDENVPMKIQDKTSHYSNQTLRNVDILSL